MIEELVERIRSGEILPSEHLEEKIEVLEEREGELNAFITKTVELAREQAKRADRLVKEGKGGAFYGIVWGIKDNFALKGVRMTCASKMLENYVPPYTATAVEKVLQNNGVILGKLNMDEFACGSSGETSYFGPTRNPHDPERVPGGSSSGAGAAVAAGMVDLALGSDTGGSIRNPASFNGVVGLKPTYGLISRYGLVDLAMSLDVPGPLAPDSYGVALAMDVLHGYDPRDRTTVRRRLDFVAVLDSFDPDRIRIGFSEALLDGVEEPVRRAVLHALRFFEQKGVEVVDVDLPDIWVAFPTYYLVMYPEFASAMQKFDGILYGHRVDAPTLYELVSRGRAEGFGKEIKRRVILGTYISMAENVGRWYTLALKARRTLQETFDRAFQQADMIISPTVPFLPFPLGSRIDDPIKMYMSDALTVPANLTGIPAISFPGGWKDRLPIGVQLMGPKYSDPLLVSAVRFFEREGRPWYG
ncbi:TPA: Asp-tRNA(Asn)/Glu-tRNA(Gln) amidotransferase subunit GatA [Candidatus Micrarchaeota archaeon]|nr:Asp-tRNA(Asn)/Glu-tRNA(Gln) amidotransferase subunit GatA [Candidatus Micrarchaeota archaeon]